MANTPGGNFPVAIPRRVQRGEAIRAADHNSLVDAVLALSRRVGFSFPDASKPAGESKSFVCSYNSADNEMTISGGTLLLGTGMQNSNGNTVSYVFEVDPIENAVTGKYGYLQINSSEDGTFINAVPLVSDTLVADISVTNNAATVSNVLLAEYTNNTFTQHRFGDFCVTTWAVSGFPALWVEYNRT